MPSILPAASPRLAPDDVLETAAGTGVLTRALAPAAAAGDAHRGHRSQPADARPGREAAAGRHRRVAAGRCARPAVRRSKLRCRGLPVRRDVLSRQGAGLQGSAPGAEAGRALPVQRLGPHRGERVRRRRDAGAGRASSRTIRRASWRARRTATTMSSASGRTSRRRASPTSPSTRVDARSRAPSARHVAVAYCQGTPLRNEIEARDASRLEEATRPGGRGRGAALRRGAVDGRIRAIVISVVTARCLPDRQLSEALLAVGASDTTVGVIARIGRLHWPLMERQKTRQRNDDLPQFGDREVHCSSNSAGCVASACCRSMHRRSEPTGRGRHCAGPVGVAGIRTWPHACPLLGQCRFRSRTRAVDATNSVSARWRRAASRA